MKGWLSLDIEAEADHAEVLSDALLQLGALSVSIEDADANTFEECPIFGEPGEALAGMWRRNVISALFASATDIPAIVAALEQAHIASTFTYRVRSIDEQDWVRATQVQFDPIRIRDDLWIVPSWHVAPNPQALNVVLDPGLAFGTGSHPTTQLCLAWLADHLQAGACVLDYGCGSGILAITAKLLGAGEVLGVDIDAQAIAASYANAAANGAKVRFALPDEMPPVIADIVLANILAKPLMMLAPMLTSRCRRGGQIVLSGILKTQIRDVSACYQVWFDMEPPVYQEEWALLIGRKR